MNIKYIKYLAKGHRGVIYIGIYKGKKVAIKTKKSTSTAVGNIEKEGKWLKILNRYNIGSKLIYSGKNFFVYKFVNGIFIPDFFKNEYKTKIKNIIKKVFLQCYTLDKLGIDKEEMHRPYKHIIIEKGEPVMIDFERIHEVKVPKNVTQFCQYIMSTTNMGILNKKGFKINRKKIIAVAREYKGNQTKKNLMKILKVID